MITEKLRKLEKDLFILQDEYDVLYNGENVPYYVIDECKDRLKEKYREFKDEYERDGSVLVQYKEWVSIDGRNGFHGIVKYEERSKLAMFDIEDIIYKSQNYGNVEKIKKLVDAFFAIYGIKKQGKSWLRLESSPDRIAISKEVLDRIRESSIKIIDQSGEIFINASEDKEGAKKVIEGLEKFLISPKTFFKSDGLFTAYKKFYLNTRTKE